MKKVIIGLLFLASGLNLLAVGCLAPEPEPLATSVPFATTRVAPPAATASAQAIATRAALVATRVAEATAGSGLGTPALATTAPASSLVGSVTETPAPDVSPVRSVTETVVPEISPTVAVPAPTRMAAPTTVSAPLPADPLPSIPPVFSNLTPTPNTTVKAGPTVIAANLCSTSPITELNVLLDGNRLDVEIMGPGQAQQSFFVERELGPGTHTIKVTARNAAGGSCEAKWSFTSR